MNYKAMIKGTDFTGLSVTMLCHDGEGKLLMHRRTDKCRDEHWTWDFGGGGVRFGESVEEAVRRELVEEYSVEALETEYLGHRELFREHDGRPTHWITFDFKLLVDPARVVLGEPHKAEQMTWFRIDALPDPLHSAIPDMLKVRGHYFE